MLLRDILSPLSNVAGITSAESMFYGAGNITNFKCSTWFDVASINITSAQNMFRDAKKFNQNLNSWDMGKVTTTESMFNYAEEFNSPIDNWDVSSLTTMTNSG